MKLLQTEEMELWETANAFRGWVTSEIAGLASAERESLRGDYLFVIDGEPRFVVIVEGLSAWSGLFVASNKIALDGNCPIQYAPAAVDALIAGAARSTILTDSVTLKRLLQGTLRASVSFVSGRVQIKGDLAAFMRLVSNLKRQGVGPLSAKKALEANEGSVNKVTDRALAL